TPTLLAAISNQWVRGAKAEEVRIHPLRKYFDELQPSASLLTPRRTMTEADLDTFACLSSDFFYAHMDMFAAGGSIFGGRVVHG
ncbi:MaoC/PaaZ C-terminal domain-containing protein, partial [Escherichia coli]|nr:MaoC/PaaZ C-terminal domain-containing protein [Escherichia coli]